MVTEEDVAEIVLETLKTVLKEESASPPILKEESPKGGECFASFASPPISRPRNFRKQIDEQVPRTGKWGFHVRELYNAPYTSLPAKRIFLSEYEIKLICARQKLDPKILKVPREAIVSPLAQDWLAMKGIKVTQE